MASQSVEPKGHSTDTVKCGGSGPSNHADWRRSICFRTPRGIAEIISLKPESLPIDRIVSFKFVRKNYILLHKYKYLATINVL